MRPYRNITDSELDSLGALPGWDGGRVQTLPLPSKMLWVHANRDKSVPLDLRDTSIVKTVTALAIRETYLLTDFGSYSLSNGKNIRDHYGCHTTDDCFGQLYLLKESHALSD